MPCGGCSGCCSNCCHEEFQWRKLWFGIVPADRRYFTHPQWTFLRFGWFAAWKILVALYFTIWLALSVMNFVEDYPRTSHHEKWLIYLTNWTYLIFVMYLLVAATNVILEFIHKKQGRVSGRTWYYGIQWLLWNVGAPATLVVVLLFWTVLVPEDPSLPSSVSTIHVHLINGIVLLIDQSVHAMPMQLMHFYQPVAYASGYAIFTGIYFASNGTDPDGKPYIYPVITDYWHHPGLAVGADFVVVLIVIPLVWFCLWLLYKLRTFLWKRYDPHWHETYNLNHDPNKVHPPAVQLAVVSVVT